MALWDGRFANGPAEEMQQFSESLSTDLQMWKQDIQGSIAHATMLHEVSLLTKAERDTLIAGLREVGRELDDPEGWRPSIADEDIHMAVEGRLHMLVGPIAGKLHTARSRNDQVATDVRLWLRARLDQLDTSVATLISTLLERIEHEGRTLIPGYTHLQRGQPIWLGHHLLAHTWALSRDRERIQDAKKRVNRSPLGAAAMAGTPHPIDRLRTAALLGFDGVVENAMDAVAARDHLIESVSAAAILSTHLSRMAEELVLWSTSEFGLIQLGEDWSTGSSIMPQKRNPDAPELVRGKTGRVVGALMNLITLVKSLPLAYNRDLQEDRPPLFDALITANACTSVLRGCYASLTIQPDALRIQAGAPLFATEIADYLASKDVPFREAHHVAGRLVRTCEERGITLIELTDDELKKAHRKLDGKVRAWLTPESAVERRNSRGGTAWNQVIRQVGLLRDTLPNELNT